jgi:hypothetical protein
VLGSVSQSGSDPPPPIVSVGRDVGDALSVPLDRIQNAFPPNTANPVADALAVAPEGIVRLQDLAAVHHAVYPNSGFFNLRQTRLIVDPGRRDECLAALVALATSRPAAPPARGG